MTSTIKLIATPLALLAIALSLIVVWRVFQLPPEEKLIEVVERYFERYGYWIVFASALIEGLLLVGMYYPGGFVIFLGVIFAGKNVPRVAGVVLIVTIALLLAYLLDYLLGRYGWYQLLVKFGLRRQIEQAQQRLTRYGANAILVSCWQPNLAALTATAAGILQFPFQKFFLYSAIGAIAWDTFWATLIYVLGRTALEFTGIRFGIVVIIGWILLVVIQHAVRSRISKAHG